MPAHVSSMSDIHHIKRRFEKLQAEKQYWVYTWQLIAEYVRSRKATFTHEVQPGQFLTGHIYDSTASQSNHKMAASLIGALYPNGSKSIEIKPHPSLKGRDAQDVKEYFDEVTKIVIRVLSSYKAGFTTSLQEYMSDQGAFGTSGIYVYASEDKDAPVRYKAVDVRESCIDEGADGFVDTWYRKFKWTVKQVVEEYGIENVSVNTAEKFHKEQYDEMVVLLHLVEPRKFAGRGVGNMHMPVRAVHIEWDHDHKLRESGYMSMPVMITRFWKETGEKYGRSPAMEAMPDILEINAERQAAILAIEKALDPPLALFDDGTLGGGVVDTSAGALSVFKVSGNLGKSSRKIIEQLVTTGELTSTYKHMLELQEIITQMFFIDRLTDLNNDTRMTLGEANIRNELRGQSLGSIYERQIVELFNPVIERTIEILIEKNMLGVAYGSWQHQAALERGEDPLIIPDAVLRAMANGLDVYEINYISPAIRIMRQEELTGITRLTEYALSVAQIKPEILDNLNFDDMVRRVQELVGAPSSNVVSMDEVRKLRAARQEMQEKMQQAQMQMEATGAVKNLGAAAKHASDAGVDVSEVA